MFAFWQTKQVMAGNILTPSLLWKGFSIKGAIQTEEISTKTEQDIVISEFYLNGEKKEDGNVKIFCKIVRSVKATTLPAILLVEDFSKESDNTFAIKLAKKGYYVMSVDLAGKREGVENHTIYPESLSYANLPLSEYKNTIISGSIKNTCWFEWACVLKYALAYLKSDSSITKIGVIGISHPATALWQVVGTEQNIDCAVFVGNAGWQGYKGINKFGDELEPQFGDSKLKYIAGIEPQSYSKNITCPCLVLSPTNSAEFDCDRAYDTVSKIPEKVFKGVDYSVGRRQSVDYDRYKNMITFLDYFLLKGKSSENLPEWPDAKVEIKEGKVIVSVNVYGKGIEKIQAYISEEIYCPELRCWQAMEEIDDYNFQYVPFNQSGMVVVFCRVEYKNGLSLSSNILCKKFNSEEIVKTHKSQVIYATREEKSASHFTIAKENVKNPMYIDLDKDSVVKSIVGPMNIPGITCKNGLLTFKIISQKDKPQDDALLMLDAFVKDGGTITIKLIENYFQEKIEYVATATINNGNLWQNIKFERANFKSNLGRPLKSYLTIEAIEITAENQFAVNNILWI